MKKISPIIIIIFVVLAVGAIMFVSRNYTTKPGVNVTTEKKPGEKKEGVFDSIRDAISKSLSLKCEYKTDKTKTVAYIKGTTIRVDSSGTGKTKSGAIIKDNKLWSWDVDKKEGVIMPLQMNKDKGLSSEEIVNNLEKEKQFCRTAVFSDSVFNPPTDVKFKDLGALFEKISGIPQ